MPSFFKKPKDIGVLLLRLFIGTRLLYGVLDNILSWAKMLEFRDFLQLFQFPMPLLAAVVSVYAQAVCGLLILIGWKIRWAAAIMVVHFLIALLMVHWGQTVEQMTPALALLFSNLLFLFAGAGHYAADREPLESPVPVFNPENQG